MFIQCNTQEILQLQTVHEKKNLFCIVCKSSYFDQTDLCSLVFLYYLWDKVMQPNLTEHIISNIMYQNDLTSLFN